MTAQQPIDTPDVDTVLPPGAIGDREMAPRSSITWVRPPESEPRGAAPFDGYPYLVTRIGHSALRHVAVLPATWSRERLLDLTRGQVLANRLDTCLVLRPGDAVYITANGIEDRAAMIPTGLPVVERLRLAEHLPRTPEIAARRARLRAYGEVQDGPRYIVGDGLEAGRPAVSDDLVRLIGLDGTSPHPGLARCLTCGEFAGDYLATRGEGNGDWAPRVIRVHCRCDNHNRCARCGEPLAPRRLSAYYFIEETGSVCYVAAYSALSHRCRRPPIELATDAQPTTDPDHDRPRRPQAEMQDVSRPPRHQPSKTRPRAPDIGLDPGGLQDLHLGQGKIEDLATSGQ
jgi:hypothetical protein